VVVGEPPVTSEARPGNDSAGVEVQAVDADEQHVPDLMAPAAETVVVRMRGESPRTAYEVLTK
jgi:hypothetical protein